VIEQILQADRYLQVDQIGKARDVYQKVVDMDPGNAIAVVGLARCALAEGQDPEAYELASRALEIDPENDMARRMEARLSEILATRGAPVERPAAAAPGADPPEMRPVVTETPATTPAAAAAPAAPTSTRPDEQAAGPPADPPAPIPPGPRPSTPPPNKPKEPTVRKSLFDRLLGR
jgi:tetratricopeptide (TPR) repeat protein